MANDSLQVADGVLVIDQMSNEVVAQRLDISSRVGGIQPGITINFHNSWLSHVTSWNFDEYFCSPIALSYILPPKTQEDL